MKKKVYFPGVVVLTGFCLIISAALFAENEETAGQGQQVVEPARKVKARIEAAAKAKMELSEDGRTLLRVTDQNRKNFTIPAGVTKIGGHVFEKCEKLRKVVIPDTVTVIGAWAFNFCGELKTLTIPASVVQLHEGAFGCSGIKRLVLPENITKIPGQMCIGCGNLERVTIPEGVTSIGTRAFAGCGKLQEITIPASVTSIGAEAFPGASLKVMPKNSVFYADKTGVLFNKVEKKLLIAPANLSRRYKIPDGIEEIEKGAFRNCGKSAPCIEIPASVTKIGDAAFESVAEVKLLPGNTVFKLDEKGVLIDTVQQKIIFAPPSLKDEYVVPDGILYIGGQAFKGCTELTGVKLPEGLLRIGGRAFYRSGLRHIDVPDSVTFIGGQAFSHCGNLLKCKLPENLETMESEILCGCLKLREITIPPKVVKILTLALEGTGVSEIFVPDNVQVIHGARFEQCPKLTLISLPAHIPAAHVKNWNLHPRCKVVWRKKEKTYSQKQEQ